MATARDASAAPFLNPSTPYGFDATDGFLGVELVEHGYSTHPVAGRRGAIEVLKRTRMGGLRRVELVALDGDARPVAFADAAGLTFVLDAAAAEVLVFEDLRPDGVIARLPTGPEPSSLATGYYGADGDDPFVAVANGGSGDISVWRRRASGAFEGGERVAVGERPARSWRGPPQGGTSWRLRTPTPAR